MAAKRKFLDLNESELATMQAEADALGVTLSGLGRAWIDLFLETGSTYQKPPRNRVQIIADEDTLIQAEARARAENGVGLTDILRHQIAQLQQ